MITRQLIDLAQIFPAGSLRRKLLGKTLVPVLERLIGVPRLNRTYADSERLDAANDYPNNFAPILEASGAQYEVTHGSLESIPANGPVLIVANHPFGGIDGIILGDLIASRRPDSKLMGNFLLKKIPLIADDIIAVDPFGRQGSKAYNRQGMTDSLRYLRDGHCLAVFPAGTVAHAHDLKLERKEGDWHPSIARIAQKTGATVVPMHIEGRTSRLFNLLGLIHPRIRTALLVREYNKARGKRIGIRIGQPIAPSLSAKAEDAAELSRFYQMRSHVLAHTATETEVQQEMRDPSGDAPIAERENPQKFIDEIHALPESARLVTRGSFHVYAASAAQIPHLLQEIGRTREHTFRAVGEGTGKSLDLDRFDDYYDHLFLWNDETCEIVGAYRIGKVNEIVAKHGNEGLYSSTIFKYSDDAFDTIGKVLELGRSYIVPAYQRRGTSLFLLWKGIMAYVLASDGYTKLFGAVSTSDDYQPLSKALILNFLRNHKMHDGFSQKIQPHTSPDFENLRSLRHFDYPGALPGVDEVSSLIEEIEPDSKGIPTLLKHYLGLNGVMLNFGVNGQFSDAMEGIILVDLTLVEPKVLAKYGDTEGVLTRHKEVTAEA